MSLQQREPSRVDIKWSVRWGAGPASLVYIDTGFVQIFGFKIQDFFPGFFPQQ